MADQEFDQHTHEAMVHQHEHWHVTHNWSETAGTFEHLAARHSHEHDHASLTRAHVPHVDFDAEHAGEAHVHDHDQPVDAGPTQASQGSGYLTEGSDLRRRERRFAGAQPAHRGGCVRRRSPALRRWNRGRYTQPCRAGRWRPPPPRSVQSRRCRCTALTSTATTREPFDPRGSVRDQHAPAVAGIQASVAGATAAIQLAWHNWAGSVGHY